MARRLILLLWLLAWAGVAPAAAQQLADPKTITAANASCLVSNCVEVSTRGVPSLGIDVSGSGTFTLVVEGTRNGGTTWRTLTIIDDSDQDALASDITAAGSFSTVNSGYTAIRVRASALTDGTPVVTVIRGVLAPLTALGGGGGGGTNTEYLEGATDASIAGVAAMTEGPSNTLAPLQSNAAKDLLVAVNAALPTGTNSLGQVTANAGTNLNTSALALETGGNLATIASAVTGTVTVDGSGSTQPVSAATLPLPSGAATSANQTTGNGLLTTIDADTSAVAAAAATIAATPLIRVGVFDASDTQITSFGGGGGAGGTTQDADDGSIASGQTVDLIAGLPMLYTGSAWVRTPGDATNGMTVNLGSNNDVTVTGAVTATLSATDNAVLDDIADGIPVTNAGTFAVQCSNCSGSGASGVDDAAFTIATDSVAPAGFLFDEVTPDSVNEGDVGLARMSANRVPYATLRDAAGNERGANVTAGNALVVDGSASTQPVSGTVTADAGTGPWPVTDNGGSLTIDAPVGTPAFVRLSDGTSAITTLPVSLASVPSHAVTNAGTFATQAAQSGTWNITNVSGTVSLPTGAATETTLGGVLTSTNYAAAFGTAGSADAQVMSVQGIASMTPVQVQSNSASLATETTLSAMAANLASLATYLQPGSGALIRSDNTDNDDETEIKATAGVLLAISGRNSSADTDAYVRCTNATAASTTPGTTTVIYEMMLPYGGGFVQGSLGPAGMAFGTALTCYLATGTAVTDTTDPAQDAVVVNLTYR